MGYRNGAIPAEEENGVSTSINDALLFTTMCIIGQTVDVQVKDGSIYSGMLYTACVDNAYTVILKKARKIKKGNQETNVADGKLIDTLVILSEDLVQVVAKELLLSAERIHGKVGADDIGAVPGIVPQNLCDERLAIATNSIESSLDKDTDNSRCLHPIRNSVANGSPKDASVKVARQKSDGKDSPVEIGIQKSDSTNFNKRGKTNTVSSKWRLVRDRSDLKQIDLPTEPALPAEQNTGELEGSRSSLDACGSRLNASEKINSGINKDEGSNSISFERTTAAKLDGSHVRHTLEETVQSLALSSSASADAISDAHVSSDFSLNSSFASNKVVLPKNGGHGQATKESKLNPRAKLFSPSPLQHRSTTPPSVPSPPSMSHTPDPLPIATGEPEVDISPFAYHSSVPSKFVPHNNHFSGNGRGDLPYVHHVFGHAGTGTTPVRYAGQYNHYQAGTGYVHPSSQNIMAGRMGPRVYLHTDSNGAAGFSQLSSQPLMAPPVNLPKHQETGTMPALQLYVAPPFIANGLQTFAMPTYLPISPPFFPVVGSIPELGSEDSLSTKFA